MQENSDFGQYPLTEEEARAFWMRCTEFMNDFYVNVFKMEDYMPVVKDGCEAKLNMLQFATNYTQGLLISPYDKATMVMWTTQAAFWLGYLEGKRAADTIELPQGFFDAIGE